jgi:DNA-binding XRE family transcriptional regulator
LNLPLACKCGAISPLCSDFANHLDCSKTAGKGISQGFGDHLCRRRLDLKPSQKEVAGLLGVDATMVTSWEKNRFAPALHANPKIIESLGYIPIGVRGDTLGERIKTCPRLPGIDPSVFPAVRAAKAKLK